VPEREPRTVRTLDHEIRSRLGTSLQRDGNFFRDAPMLHALVQKEERDLDAQDRHDHGDPRGPAHDRTAAGSRSSFGFAPSPSSLRQRVDHRQYE
jgi:hypothetical protein